MIVLDVLKFKLFEKRAILVDALWRLNASRLSTKKIYKRQLSFPVFSAKFGNKDIQNEPRVLRIG